MTKITTSIFTSIIALGFAVSCTAPAENESITSTQAEEVKVTDPLPSWNDTETKKAIIAYVEDVTTEGNPDYIKVADRIATIDNDGTLWSEQPIYFQFFFALNRVKEMAAEHPEWKNEQPFKAVLENDMKTVASYGEKGLLQIVMATHTNITTDEFDKLVSDWISTAKHPTKNRLFTDLVFQPMLELLDYLRANDFKTFIVSGGGIEFMRPWVEQVYGIPKDQVVGSSFKTKYEYNDGKPAVTRLAEFDLIDDKDGKPVGINRYIGRKPVFVAGNSDGDLQMMHWGEANELKSFQLYVHHTDSVREWSYDRTSHIGQFDKALDEANEKGWTLVDMKNDWKVIYPFELKN